MGLIDDIFAKARTERRGLVLPFLTAGDPDLAATARLLGAFERAGVEIAEIGIPFSDPIADGPVIAESMHEALKRGVTPRGVFDAVRSLRASGAAGAKVALVAMVSVSIVHRLGGAAFVREAAKAGFAGVIVPDIDLATAPSITAACDECGIACAYLVAPTTSPERLRTIVGLCRGFVYLLARAGITGESSGLPEIEAQVKAIRAVHGELPIAAGFGIATPEQVGAALRHADGAIVGSALVRRIASEVAAGRDPCAAIETTVRELVSAGRG